MFAVAFVVSSVSGSSSRPTVRLRRGRIFTASSLPHFAKYSNHAAFFGVYGLDSPLTGW